MEEQLKKNITDPSASSSQHNPVLTNIAQINEPSGEDDVHMFAGPTISSETRGGLLPIINPGDLYRDEAEERADGTPAPMAGFRLSTTPFYCRKYSFADQITAEERQHRTVITDIAGAKARNVASKVRMHREGLFLNRLFTTGKWTNEETPTTLWDADMSDPIADVTGYRIAQKARSGKAPNIGIVSEEVLNALEHNDAILARFQNYGTPGDPRLTSIQTLMAVFKLERLYVAGSVVNNADEGATDSFAFRAGKHMLLAYAPETAVNGDVSAFYTYRWSGSPQGNVDIGVRNYTDDARQSDVVEANSYWDVGIVGQQYATMITNVIS